ncbi:thioredoxin family protein [Flavilitoribacter nigricans]|uniref:Spermatogenesis-associated protein 20-like TRX domain-containing protein n=1 Tax=Flavilitoribacter nigricans (strain ATCC 23147 / DSM 23189 / NBRC 102662 / NCIMB 1420 / SS-2) TaxID=1122177 RepID=A0A2D0N6D1_FLAN2|nr:DUF255 domain-containing protein [Flavilitoribacter nigricans]PHN03936.1 hypothetical protein CRP01_23995 [Flavilitoribacter nigricans DSM 23189 = NBRC 102662]
MKKVLFLPLPKIASLFILAVLMWQCSSNAPAEDAATTAAAPTETTATPQPAVKASPAQAAPVSQSKTMGENSDEIQWMSWDEAVASIEDDPKMMFIDVYTDWCGWCKVMDKQTFTDPEVINYINDNYYAVKFNAETEDPVTFRGQEFKVVEGGRRGIHTLAYALLEGQLSYPSYVYLNSNFQRVNVSKGFKQAEPFLAEMKAITEASLQ